MTIAGFLHPLQTLLPPVAGAAPLGGAGGTSGSLPNFAVARQEQSNWCWAAVSSSVANFFGPPQWTQCRVASAELAPLNCCGGDASGSCNQEGYLDRALQRVGHFNQLIFTTLNFGAVQNELNATRPVGCRIAWSGGGAHFVALGGWLIAGNGTQYVDVYDPFYGPTQKKYSDFVSGYMTQGDSWSHTYLTATAAAAAAGGGGPVNPNSPKNAGPPPPPPAAYAGRTRRNATSPKSA